MLASLLARAYCSRGSLLPARSLPARELIARAINARAGLIARV